MTGLCNDAKESQDNKNYSSKYFINKISLKSHITILNNDTNLTHILYRRK